MQVVCPKCLVANRVPRERLADRPVCGKCHAALSPQEPVVLGDRSFDRFVGASDLPVLVDFWADWCGPCRAMNPILQTLARNRIDLRIAKVNVDTEGQLAQRFSIRSIPLLVLMRRGAELGRLNGALPTEELSAWLEATLLQSAGGTAS